MATAPHAEHWLLLQYEGAWGKKAVEESELSASVQAHLQRLVLGVAHGRLGLVKQGQPDSARALLAITCSLPQPRMFRYTFDNLDELGSVEATALFAGRTPGAECVTDPLYVVCTNGKRDRCCAELGLPLYRRLSSLRPGQVWQITHIGGHRFSANLGCVPEGIFYGRLDETRGPETLLLHESGRLDLAHCRGRSAWPEAVQAAELLMRQALDQVGVEFIQSASYDVSGETARVTMRLAGGETVDVEVAATPGTLAVPASCGSAQGEPRMEYRLSRVPTIERR